MARGSNMDPTHHEKIVDKLMQYRGKIPKVGHLTDKVAQDQAYMLRMNLDYLIQRINEYAEADARGWIQ
jgi:hypothetical protein